MRIILIGAGILGKIIFKELRKYSELDIITVSRSGATDIHADISSADQIKAMYAKVGSFDSVINVAGHCWIGPFDEMTEENWYFGIKTKMMGQINLVMIGKELINDNGSFTLTTGFLSDDFLKGTINYSVVNGGLENFVRASVLELKRGIRINAISPGFVLENYDGRMNTGPAGFYPVSHDRITHAYYKSAFGDLTGRVFNVR